MNSISIFGFACLQDYISFGIRALIIFKVLSILRFESFLMSNSKCRKNLNAMLY